MIKRLLDIFISLSAIFLLLPFGILVFLALKVFDNEKVIEKNRYIGKHRKIIILRRFNVSNRYHSKSKIARTIKESLFITGLDGWPLLFSVLKGDLSIVGPKPEF